MYESDNVYHHCRICDATCKCADGNDSEWYCTHDCEAPIDCFALDEDDQEVQVPCSGDELTFDEVFTDVDSETYDACYEANQVGEVS